MVVVKSTASHSKVSGRYIHLRFGCGRVLWLIVAAVILKVTVLAVNLHLLLWALAQQDVDQWSVHLVFQLDTGLRKAGYSREGPAAAREVFEMLLHGPETGLNAS